MLGLGFVIFLIGLKSDYELDKALQLLEEVGSRLKAIEDTYEEKKGDKNNEIRELKSLIKQQKERES